MGARPATRAASPKVGADLHVVDPADLDGADDWIGADVRGGRIDPHALPREISGCRFTNCSLVGAVLEDARVVDVVFDTCDLSGLVLAEASLTRVELRGCRVSGLDLGGARIENLVAAQSKLDGSSLRAVRGRNVEWDECDLSDSDFSSAQLQGARLVACDLTGCQFSGANLTGAQLHRSTLEEIRGVAGLKGVVIDPTQAVPLGLLMLGAMDVRIDAADEALP